MVNLPVLTRLQITDYGLFPGYPRGSGIDRPFDAGVTIIAGINGLGKTTLLTAILRALTGPFDLTGDGVPTEMGVSIPDAAVRLKRKAVSFFKQRVADEALNAVVRLTATFGAKTFVVARSLADLSLIKCEIDGVEAICAGSRDDRELAYQRSIADLMGLASFVDVLLVLHHVVMFQEDRPGALWDENAQRQILRALFLAKDDARRVAELERLVQSADSQARNINARITATHDELQRARKLEAGSGAAVAQLEAEQKLLDAEIVEKARLENVLSELEQERLTVRREHEKAKIVREEASGAVERIKYSALANLYPAMDDASRLVIARILTKAKCLVCDADAPSKRDELEALLAEGMCPSCGAPPDQQHNVVGKYKFEQAKLDLAREQSRLADLEETAKGRRLADIGTAYESTLTRALELGGSIADRRARHHRLRAQLPGGQPSSEIETALTTLRRQHDEWKTKLAGHLRDLTDILRDKEELISSRAADVLKNFAELSGKLLAEPARLAEVKLTPRYTQSEGAGGGSRLSFPAYKAEMVAANRPDFVRRDDPTDVSESQRELIDLAFRLALVRVAAPGTPATFIMETPEASLDGVAMERVGQALGDFAANSDNRLIVTSNLSNAGLITSLFGGKALSPGDADSRRARLLDLLRVAAPNRALERDRAAYEKLLDEAVTGGG